VRVEEVGPAQWRAWRDLRLEALQDTPIGFMEWYDDAVLVSDEEWQERMAKPGLRVLVHDGDRAVGMGGGFRAPDGKAVLFAIYVTPSARGRGVLDAIVEAVAAWAAPDPLTLDVHADNTRAHRAYLRLGFVDTGVITPGGGIDGGDLVGMTR
jgi:GNAT superfamily N-acetyltransferase